MILRIRILFLFFLFLFATLFFRLFYWQILKAKKISSSARQQYESEMIIPSQRGRILAKDGSLLVGNKEVYLLFANPQKIDREKVARISSFLASLLAEKDKLEKERERIRALLERKDLMWVPIKHKLSRDTKENIEKEKIEGIGFQVENMRFYPEASAAAHLLGFVGKNREGEDVGYFGLEGYYDTSLKGRSGFVKKEIDALGLSLIFGKKNEVRPASGVDLLTHIDKGIQLMVEEKLKDGIERYGARGGTVIIMNPESGAIQAMASLPSYDPAQYQDSDNEFFRNPAISDTFEPGSIFKIVVMASALDSGVVNPETICDICNAPFKVDKYFIRTWNDKYHENSNMVDVIVNSDNVGMAFVAQKIGVERLYSYLEAFGFTKKTGIDLQGEVEGVIKEKNRWSLVDLVTAGFGQGIAVTPIQMTKAVSIIANGGYDITPHVVDKLIGEGWEEDIEERKGKRVISEKAAKEITAMMVEAAKKGEAKWTHLPGFKVAGKTGTAQIPIAGHYDAEKTIASFVGFAPYDKPKFVMLVTLREPTSSPWASETAAPLWYNIAKDLFLFYGIHPD